MENGFIYLIILDHAIKQLVSYQLKKLCTKLRPVSSP